MIATDARYETVTVTFTDEERELIAHHAEQATLPVGRSKIFCGDQENLDRREFERNENQHTGMACEAAFYKWAAPLGSGDFAAFLANRELRNSDKFTGDKGIDCVLPENLRVDIKGSEPQAGKSLDVYTALNLHLTHERDKSLAEIQDIAYVFAVTQRELSAPCRAPKFVILSGWLWGRELYGREDKKSLAGWSAKGWSLHRMHEFPGVAQLANCA